MSQPIKVVVVIAVIFVVVVVDVIVVVTVDIIVVDVVFIVVLSKFGQQLLEYCCCRFCS